MLGKEQLQELKRLASDAMSSGGNLAWLSAEELAVEWPQWDADFVAAMSPYVALSLLDHIASLEENATDKALALKAAKAMQQAETERADANERDAERYRWLRTADPDKIQDPELHEAVGNLPAEPTDVDEAIDQAMRNQ